MALGQTTKKDTSRIFLTIKNGKIVHDNKEEYETIDGTLERITLKESTFRGEVVKRWYIDLKDGEELYSICIGYSSGVFKSIILALANAGGLKAQNNIQIVPYQKGNYTKVKTYHNGEKLNWIEHPLPEVKDVEIGGKVIKDDTERMRFIESLVENINKRLTK